MKVTNIECSKTKYNETYTRWNTDKSESRSNMAALTELAENIRTIGLLNPIYVKPEGNDFRCLAGNRRLHAMKEILQAKTIPAVVVKSADDYAIAISENLERKDITSLELGQWIATAVAETIKGKKYGKLAEVMESIASRTGLSVRRVYELRKLWRDTTPEEKTLIQSGKESASAVDKKRVKRQKETGKTKTKKTPLNKEVVNAEKVLVKCTKQILEKAKVIKHHNPEFTNRQNFLKTLDILVKTVDALKRLFDGVERRKR